MICNFKFLKTPHSVIQDLVIMLDMSNCLDISSCLQSMHDSRGSVVCRSCLAVTNTSNVSALPDNPFVMRMLNNNNDHYHSQQRPGLIAGASPPPVTPSQVVELVESALVKIPAMKAARSRKAVEMRRVKEMVETLGRRTVEILNHNLRQRALLDTVETELGELKVKLETKINPGDIRSLNYVYGKTLELRKSLNTEVEFCCIEDLKEAAHQSKVKMEFERPAEILSRLGAGLDKMFMELLASPDDDPNVFVVKSLLVDILANKIAEGNPRFREIMMADMEIREPTVLAHQLETLVEDPVEAQELDIAGAGSSSFIHNEVEVTSPAVVSPGSVRPSIPHPAKPSFSEMAKKPAAAAAEPTPPKSRRMSTKHSSRPRCFLQLQEANKPPFRVVIELRPDVAPMMVENFLRLCQGLPDGRGYRGSRLFRAKKDDYVAGGDFEYNDGTGSQSSYEEEYFLADRSTLGNHKGAIRMKGVQRTSDGRCKIGSQFMIWVADMEDKGYQHSLVFGAVVDGLQELVEISRIGSRQRGPVSWLMNSHVTIIDCGVL